MAYKTYTVELFPTVVRTIAVNTFSLTSMVGSVLAPQLIFLKVRLLRHGFWSLKDARECIVNYILAAHNELAANAINSHLN